MSCVGPHQRGFTQHAFKCSISDALALDLDETAVCSNTSKTIKIGTDKIMYNLDDNLTIFYFKSNEEATSEKWSP